MNTGQDFGKGRYAYNFVNIKKKCFINTPTYLLVFSSIGIRITQFQHILIFIVNNIYINVDVKKKTQNKYLNY